MDGVRSHNLWFHKLSRWFWYTLKFENYWSELIERGSPNICLHLVAALCGYFPFISSGMLGICPRALMASCEERKNAKRSFLLEIESKVSALLTGGNV